jgi:hypothetical protein
MDGENTLGPNLFQSLSGVKPPKKLKGADETSKEVERVTQQMLGDFGGGIVKAFHPDGSPFMTMEF